MYSKRILLTVMLLVTILTIAFFVSKSAHPIRTALVSPSSSVLSAPVPSASPKTFEFDSSTDLKAELENINPQVLDSDFELYE